MQYGGAAFDGSAQAVVFHFRNDECSTSAGLDKHRSFRRFRAAQITDVGGVFAAADKYANCRCFFHIRKGSVSYLFTEKMCVL
jgi:hypothetical protein